MQLGKELLHQIADQKLTPNERARLRCELAGQLEEAGEYELARKSNGRLVATSR